MARAAACDRVWHFTFSLFHFHFFTFSLFHFHFSLHFYGTPSRAAPTQQRLCFLSYVQPVHYNVICPADAPASTEVL